MTTSLKTIIPLALVCSVLVGYQYLGAQWVGPSVGPTGGNVPAPLNVGSAWQIKNGPLGVAALDVTGDASVALDLMVSGDVVLDGGGTLVVSQVCNADRSTCGTVEQFLIDTIGDGGDGGDGNSAPVSNQNLVNGVHTEQDCTNAGGTVQGVGGTNLVCRFEAASCPAGWTSYQNWSTTVSATCQQRGGQCRACTTSSHGWSNTARESCVYPYDTNLSNDNDSCNGTRTCNATLIQVGCY